MIAACISIGTTSFSARPTSSDDRLSGETSSRSWEPVRISWVRLAPVNEAPISAVIATMPGTNHCSAEPFSTSGSSGANRPRKTSGCTIANSTEAGSRKTGLSSRTITFQVSARKPGAFGSCRMLACCGPGRAVGVLDDGGHAAAPSLLVRRWRRVISLLSRRLRPVRSRKTSSSVGPATSIAAHRRAGVGEVGTNRRPGAVSARAGRGP